GRLSSRDSRPGLLVLNDCSVPRGDGGAIAAEAPIDAEQDLVEVAVDVVGEPDGVDTPDIDQSVIEEDVVPLDPERPVGHEHILKADPHIAATGVGIHGPEQGAVKGVGHRKTLFDSAPSSLGVEQELRRDQIAEAGCDGSEPAHIAMKRKVIIDDADTAATDVGTVDHALNAEHPVRGELIVATDLAASSEAAFRKTAVVFTGEMVL